MGRIAEENVSFFPLRKSPDFGVFLFLKSPSFCSRSQAESPHIFCVLPLSDEFRERIGFLREP
jgi:hypothetical protein